jgi:hypothetical protein
MERMGAITGAYVQDKCLQQIGALVVFQLQRLLLQPLHLLRLRLRATVRRCHAGTRCPRWQTTQDAVLQSPRQLDRDLRDPLCTRARCVPGLPYENQPAARIRWVETAKLRFRACVGRATAAGEYSE